MKNLFVFLFISTFSILNVNDLNAQQSVENIYVYNNKYHVRLKTTDTKVEVWIKKKGEAINWEKAKVLDATDKEINYKIKYKNNIKHNKKVWLFYRIIFAKDDKSVIYVKNMSNKSRGRGQRYMKVQ